MEIYISETNIFVIFLFKLTTFNSFNLNIFLCKLKLYPYLQIF